MEAFEDLKSQWDNQNQPEAPKDGAKQVLEKITSIRKKQKITNFVLAITVAILIGFFFYISAYKFQTVMIGLLLMIGSIALRIGLEFSSIKTLKNIDITSSAEKFKEQMISYYKNRKKVHFIFTPIIILAYCVGFIVLLPDFKANLTIGFYNYILWSSVILLILLSLFVFREIKKELLILRDLQEEK